MEGIGYRLDGSARSFRLSIRFPRFDGTPETRSVRLLLPEDLPAGPVPRIRRTPPGQRFPLVFAVHYELPEEEERTARYLERGWAVMTPVDIPAEALANIVDEDLRFQAAVLQVARRLPFLDPSRIALRGGSAGGFQTLMLSAHQAGLRCAVSHSGVVNMAHQFAYLLANQPFNDRYEAEVASGSPVPDIASYPIPVVKQIRDAFLPTGLALGVGVAGPLTGPGGPAEPVASPAVDFSATAWALHSPVTWAGALDAPLLLTHSTADLVVPLDPVTRRYAHPPDRDTLPGGFRIGLQDLIPDGPLSVPLEDILPERDFHVEVQAVRGVQGPLPVRFRPDCRVSLHIVDEGPVDRSCGHYRHPENGVLQDELFLAAHLGSAARPAALTGDKLRVLAQRFRGCHPVPAFRMPPAEAGLAAFPGTLTADRLDVLLGLLAALGALAGEPDPNRAGDERRGTAQAGYRRSLEWQATLEPAIQFLPPTLRECLEQAAGLARTCGEPDLAAQLEERGRSLPAP